MELAKWRHGRKGILDELYDVQERMNKLFDSAIDRSFLDRWRDTTRFEPRVDVLENGNEVVVKAELPGIDPKNLNVTVENSIMTIRGECKEEREERKKRYHRIERFSGSFERSFLLPEGIDAEKIKADYKNGILNVTIPKNPETKAKQIPINGENK